MTDDLLSTIALGVGGALLAFELSAALLSLLEAYGSRAAGSAFAPPRPPFVPTSLLSPRSAVRAHLALQRDLMNAMRRQYPMLRSSRHGQELRSAIRRLPRHAITATID